MLKKTIFLLTIFLRGFLWATFPANEISPINIFSSKPKEEPTFNLKVILLLKENEEKKATVDFGIQIYELKVPGGVKRLKDHLKYFFNKNLISEDLWKIKQEIITYYQNHGRPLISVYIPPQEVSSGVVKFVVIEGKLGEVCVEGNKYFSSKMIRSYINFREGEVINERELVNNLYILNRNPFRHVDALFCKGKEKYTTDIKLLCQDRFPLRLFMGFENTGLDLTDRNRFYTGFNVGNLFFIDHQFSYQYTSSIDFKKFQAHTAQYVAPLPWWNHVLTLFGGYSSVHANLSELIEKSKSEGESGQASFRYEIPLPAYKYLLHFLTLGFDFKRTNNNLDYNENSPIFGGAVNLTQIVLGYLINIESGAYKGAIQADFFISPGEWILDQENERYEVFRYRAKNKYVYLQAKWSNLIALPHEFSLSHYIKGQLSNANLLPSELFDAGGAYSVRGYDERVLNGDSGIITSMEIRTPSLHLVPKLKKKKIEEGLLFLAFIDFGYTSLHDPIPQEKKSDYIIGVGPGFRYALSTHLAFSLDWGLKLHHAKRFGSSCGRLHFGFTLSY